jgi:hypothetical protein
MTGIEGDSSEITMVLYTLKLRESPKTLDNRGSSETWSAAGGVTATRWYNRQETYG